METSAQTIGGKVIFTVTIIKLLDLFVFVNMAEEMLSVTGYPVTTTSKKALESFNEGVKAYVTLNGNCMLHLTKALEVDSDFLLVHCILVRIFP